MKLLAIIGLAIAGVIFYRKLNAIHRKVNTAVSQQEELQQQLETINTAVEGVSGDIAELKRQLEEANQNPDIDLTPQIELAGSIAARLTALDGENPAPETEEPVEDEPVEDDEA